MNFFLFCLLLEQRCREVSADPARPTIEGLVLFSVANPCRGAGNFLKL